MTPLETTISRPMSEAEGAVREALAAQGFGILTEIDVAATLKAKIGVDREPLKILGACNPTFANEALGLDPMASLLIPCNVVLAPSADGGTHVSIVDPRELMSGSEMKALADDAAARLTAALESLGE